uniref:ATP synthase subunit gamma, mitochondrial n=1 Tax=Magallana gigas TaxID=29159 RepID=K1QKF0_MAGGI
MHISLINFINLCINLFLSYLFSTQVRGMATLKEIRVRLKSVTNIQKITKSMKMVSAAKYAKAERELKPAKPYGEQATG